MFTIKAKNTNHGQQTTYAKGLTILHSDMAVFTKFYIHLRFACMHEKTRQTIDLFSNNFNLTGFFDFSVF